MTIPRKNVQLLLRNQLTRVTALSFPPFFSEQDVGHMFMPKILGALKALACSQHKEAEITPI